MKTILPFLLLVVIACTKPKEIKTMGSVERLDPGLDKYIDANTVPEVIAEGFDWSEGPVWVETEKMLLFSDVPQTLFISGRRKAALKNIWSPPAILPMCRGEGRWDLTVSH